jgi:hypothetical protein
MSAQWLAAAGPDAGEAFADALVADILANGYKTHVRRNNQLFALGNALVIFCGAQYAYRRSAVMQP